MKIKHPLRLTFSTLLIIALSVGVIVSILKIINSSDYSVIQELKTEILSADRCNIYTHDYQYINIFQYDIINKIFLFYLLKYILYNYFISIYINIFQYDIINKIFLFYLEIYL